MDPWKASRAEPWSAVLAVGGPVVLRHVDVGLERGAGLERRHLGLGDLEGLAGLGIASLASGALTTLEGPEAWKSDLLAACDRVSDRVQGSREGLFSRLLLQACFLGDPLDELGLVHLRFLPLAAHRLEPGLQQAGSQGCRTSSVDGLVPESPDLETRLHACSLAVVVFVVLAELVAAPVVGQVSPDRVRMIGIVLGV